MRLNINIAMSVLLAAVMLLTGCTDELLTAEELQSTQFADSREVKIAVAETSWDGATVSVTRAGETLEALKENSDRTWDFTKTPKLDVSVLKAEAAKDEGARWTYIEANNRYQNSSNIDGALEANGIELYMTEGLSFSSLSDNTGDIKISQITK